MAAKNVIYFSNLPREQDEAALRAFLGKYGSITTVEMSRRNEMAWVTFATEAAATASLECADQDFHGRPIRAALSNRGEETEAKKEAKAPREKKAKAAPTEGSSAAAASTGPTIVGQYADRVIVRGLPRAMELDALKDMFAKYGAVDRVAKRRGILGLVRFETEAAATAALGATGIEMEGRKIVVELQNKIKKAPRKARAAGAPKEAAAGTTTNAAGKGRGAPKESSAASAPAEPRKSKTLRIVGLPEGLTVEALKAHFASAGAIANATISAKGSVAAVSYESPADAEKALSLNGSSLNGSEIKVAFKSRTSRKGKGAAGASGEEEEEAAAEAGAGRKRVEGDEEGDEAKGKRSGRRNNGKATAATSNA